MIAAGLGMIPLLGAYLVQVGDITRRVFLASLPLIVAIGLWAWLEELASKADDEKAGRNTLVIYLGSRFSGRYGTAALASLFFTILLAAVGSTGLVLAVSPLATALITAQQSAQHPELGDTQTCTKDGALMVYVPAGQFEMGSSQAQPIHTVALDAFWIDQTEVTNAMFTAFLNEQGHQIEEGASWWEPGAGHTGIIYGYIDEDDDTFYPRTGDENFPVIEVSWHGAAAYCVWAGGRLPIQFPLDRYEAGSPKHKSSFMMSGRSSLDSPKRYHAAQNGQGSQVGQLSKGGSECNRLF